MNLRLLNAATSAPSRSNHSPFFRFSSNRLCQYASMPAGSSVRIDMHCLECCSTWRVGITRWMAGNCCIKNPIVDGSTRMVQITSKPSIHRVSRSLPRLDSAFQHFDVRKAPLLVFRCLTDSARFAGSSSIENDFLCLRQRRRPGLQAGEGYGPFQI